METALTEEQRRWIADYVRQVSRPCAPVPTGVVPQLPRVEGVRAVCFDVYGCLLVSGAGEIGSGSDVQGGRALHDACRRLGIALTGGEGTVARAQALYREIVRREHEQARVAGIDWPEIDVRSIWLEVFVRLHSEGSLLEVPDAERVVRFAVAVECGVNPVWPMPGAADVPARLREAGIETGIISNAQCFTPIIVETLLGRRLDDTWIPLRHCRFSYAENCAKPSRVLFDGLLRTLRETRGIPADAVLYVGNDMLNDVWGAANAGCRTALFAGDAHSLRRREHDPRCVGTTPGAVITELPQILAVTGAL